MREKTATDSKIMVGKKLRKMGYFIKNENWSIDGKWESGSRIHGIKWRVQQEKL